MTTGTAIRMKIFLSRCFRGGAVGGGVVTRSHHKDMGRLLSPYLSNRDPGNVRRSEEFTDQRRTKGEVQGVRIPLWFSSSQRRHRPSLDGEPIPSTTPKIDTGERLGVRNRTSSRSPLQPALEMSRPPAPTGAPTAYDDGGEHRQGFRSFVKLSPCKCSSAGVTYPPRHDTSRGRSEG